VGLPTLYNLLIAQSVMPVHKRRVSDSTLNCVKGAKAFEILDAAYEIETSFGGRGDSAITISLSSLGIDRQRLVLAAMADAACGDRGRPVADPTGFRVFGAARRAEYRAVLLI
jgi:hypothetical protein